MSTHIAESAAFQSTVKPSGVVASTRATGVLVSDSVAPHEENLQVVQAQQHDAIQQLPTHNKIFTSLVAGATAGALAKTTIAPLDRTKINFQISNDKQYSFRGAIRFIIRSFQQEGFMQLWRGNSATMARIMPYAALQYASHEQWKIRLGLNGNGPPHTYDKGHMASARRFLAGSLAGVTASTCTYPLDLARARMAVTKKCRYHTLPGLFVTIYREEGLRVLYRGYAPTMLGVIPYAGTSFFTYETLKQIHHEQTNGAEPSPWNRLAFGAMAGLLGQTSSYPLDIVRRRMQTAALTGNEARYQGVLQTLQLIAREEGIKNGLYKGLSMNWIKGPIAVGVSFMTFDLVRLQLRRLEVFR